MVFHSDNVAVVAIIQRKSVRHPIMLHLLCCLYFYAGYFQFSYSTRHVLRVTNVTADALSWGNMLLFHSLIPLASQLIVRHELRELMIVQRPDWGSPGWIALFKATL